MTSSFRRLLSSHREAAAVVAVLLLVPVAALAYEGGSYPAPSSAFVGGTVAAPTTFTADLAVNDAAGGLTQLSIGPSSGAASTDRGELVLYMGNAVDSMIRWYISGGAIGPMFGFDDSENALSFTSNHAAYVGIDTLWKDGATNDDVVRIERDQDRTTFYDSGTAALTIAGDAASGIALDAPAAAITITAATTIATETLQPITDRSDDLGTVSVRWDEYFGGLQRRTGAVPTEPYACAAATVGHQVYVDDTNDAAAAYLCVCVDTNDGAAFDWRRVDDNAAACPAF